MTQHLPSSEREKGTGWHGLKPHNFVHRSEAEFARLLDFYQVKWQYEPTTFALERDSDGRITQAFTPDFYLPELGLYVELTTLNQKLVTRKNQKLRRLRELYPNLNIKLFYRRDLHNLMFKYGPDKTKELE
ncbi:MAG: hypothetical protein HY783_04500 [Chloroflexi bacterium]|nr:hypothetical protein [Chloroflexota bacterium]